MASAFDKNAELVKLSEKALDDLNPARVFRLFQKILDLDLPLLGIDCRPEHLLITYLAVPPVCIRPSVEMDTGAGSNEDDATTRLLAVCDMSISIRKNLEKGIAPWETVMEQWDFLQVCCNFPLFMRQTRFSVKYAASHSNMRLWMLWLHASLPSFLCGSKVLLILDGCV